MTALLVNALAPYWQAIVAGVATLVAALALYLKGRSAERQKAELEDLRNANEIRKAGAAARAGVDTSPERLRDDDGWRRPD